MVDTVSLPAPVAAEVAEPAVRRPRPPAKVVHLTRTERVAKGKLARAEAPLAGHADFSPATDRDPIALLESQATTRVPELVPIRYGRMLTSPFSFYRGAALIMASDLAETPRSNLRTQLCGDAHLSNFGVFASPERHLVFDLNDFDETLPGPFEWDVKRLAASLEIAGRDNDFKTKSRRRIVLSTVAAYRQGLREFADQTNLDVWYAHLNMDEVMAKYGPQLAPKGLKRTEQLLAKARTRDNMQAFSKFARIVDGRAQIISDPPLIVPAEELLPDLDSSALYEQIHKLVRAYRRTLQPDRRVLLEQYQLLQLARKVVGVGSVGTRAWILLMEGVDGNDPMFLQAKEAQQSVLEVFAGASEYANCGQRVVAGQRLVQAVSDIFLGWQRAKGVDDVERDYYIRQLRDWKGSVPVEELGPPGMEIYGRLCGWTLARAHARAGDRVALAAYLGGKDTFDQAVANFAVAYADQNERDHAALQAAADAGHVTVTVGI